MWGDGSMGIISPLKFFIQDNYLERRLLKPRGDKIFGLKGLNHYSFHNTNIGFGAIKVIRNWQIPPPLLAVPSNLVIQNPG